MAPIFEGTGEQMTVAKLSFYTGVCFRRSLAKLFRWYSLVAQRVKHLPAMPRKFHGWRSLVGYSPWGQKESDTTEDAHTHNLLPEDDGRNLTFHPRQRPSYNRPRQSRKELADLRHHLLDGQGAEA